MFLQVHFLSGLSIYLEIMCIFSHNVTAVFIYVAQFLSNQDTVYKFICGSVGTC